MYSKQSLSIAHIMKSGDTCPQGNTWQKPVTVLSLGYATFDIDDSIAQILDRGKPARLLLRAIGALASVFLPEYPRISDQLEERTHVGDDLVLAPNVHLFKDPPLRMNDPFGLFGLIS